MSELSERLVGAARDAATPVYESTMCPGVGCCGDFDRAVREAVVAVLREHRDSLRGLASRWRGHLDAYGTRSDFTDGYLAALSDVAVGDDALADEIEAGR